MRSARPVLLAFGQLRRFLAARPEGERQDLNEELRVLCKRAVEHARGPTVESKQRQIGPFQRSQTVGVEVGCVQPVEVLADVVSRRPVEPGFGRLNRCFSGSRLLNLLREPTTRLG